MSTFRAAALTLALPLAVLPLAGGTADATTPPAVDATTAPPTPDAAVLDPADFPVTVETSHGPVTITEPPERIVALDFGAVDTLLALGVQPTVAALGGDPATVPWLDGLLDPDSIDESMLVQRDLNVEAIAAADPDLILGAWWAVDDSMFETLSAIAPTVTNRSAGNDGWDVRLQLTAEALGLTERVAQVEADVDAAYAELADAVPELRGATYNYTGFGATDYGFFWGNGTWLEPIGLVPNDNQDNTQTAASVSLENLDQLDADVWAIWPITDDDREVLEADQRFAMQPAVASGHVIWLDTAMANATNNAGPLSLAWVVDRIAPALTGEATTADG